MASIGCSSMRQRAHSLLDIGEFSGKTADFFAAMLDQGGKFLLSGIEITVLFMKRS